MTRQESGRKGGTSSAFTRREAARARVRRMAASLLADRGLSDGVIQALVPVAAAIYDRGYHAGASAASLKRRRQVQQAAGQKDEQRPAMRAVRVQGNEVAEGGASLHALDSTRLNPRRASAGISSAESSTSYSR